MPKSTLAVNVGSSSVKITFTNSILSRTHQEPSQMRRSLESPHPTYTQVPTRRQKAQRGSQKKIQHPPRRIQVPLSEVASVCLATY
ncbi:hypothetical protein VN97_g12883 [Penicillium thymicola]|uniref:Uncharacterized protein n=1 Tax=Penicillium thymicola TaxID=293382 RepID=A0AAI9X1R2_PENTH|nr:hypothetical protein VN97_g12883 [Penicillium thymicola]